MHLSSSFDTDSLKIELRRALDELLPKCESGTEIRNLLSTPRGNKSSDSQLIYLPQACQILARLGSFAVAAKEYDEARECFRQIADLWKSAVKNFPFDSRDNVRLCVHSSRLKQYEADPNYVVEECTKSKDRGHYDVTLSYFRQPEPGVTLLAVLSALAANEIQTAEELAKSYKVYLPASTPNHLGVVISLLRKEDHLVHPYFTTSKPTGKPSLMFPPQPCELAHGIVLQSSEMIITGCSAISSRYAEVWKNKSNRTDEMLPKLMEWGWAFSLYGVAMLNLASSHGITFQNENCVSDWIPEALTNPA